MMKDEQHIDNSSSILQKIATIYADRLLSDITLQVGCQKYPAHRLILCASSDVFQVMLMNPNWTESHEKNVILTEEPACVPIFPEFLKYLYTGKLNLNYEVVLPLLALADKYNVKDLVQLCINYMLEHVASATLSNELISWLRYTQNSGHEVISSMCNNFMLWNFSLISKSNEIHAVDKDTLIKFLKSSDLIICEELTLFNFLYDWLCAQESKLLSPDSTVSKSDFDHIFYELTSCVRFPMMTPLQVANLLLHPLINHYREYILERIVIAMAFHSNCLEETMKPMGQADDHLFMPRLYTAERWCATLTIDNYHNFPVFGVRTLLFSTPSSASDHESERMYEWSVDFYPKGVSFGKFLLILPDFFQGTVEMPDKSYKRVRLAVMAKSLFPDKEKRVNIAVLLLAMQNGIEYVHEVVVRQAIFSLSQKIINFDNLVPFEMLNPTNTKSPYFVGPENNTVKIKIIVTPNS